MSTPNRLDITRAATCLALAVSLTGCTAIKGMLKPMVCDCAEATAHNSECPTPDDDEGGSSTKMAKVDQAANEDSDGEPSDSAKKKKRAKKDGDSEPSKRTIERREPKPDPLALIDPDIDDAVVASDDDDRMSTLQDDYPLGDSLAESAVVLTGNFDAGEGDEVAVVEPGRRIQIFDASGRIAELEFSSNLADTVPEDARRSGTVAVEVIRDGTAQILTHWAEQHEDGTVVYKMGLFKLIESYVGTSFEAELARKPADAESFERNGTYEFLHGDDHAYIRWIPASDSGGFDASEATVYKWNKWEGVYRVPKPPPTAPKRDKLQSQRQPAATTPLAVK
jgi:hypothetical protein